MVNVCFPRFSAPWNRRQGTSPVSRSVLPERPGDSGSPGNRGCGDKSSTAIREALLGIRDKTNLTSTDQYINRENNYSERWSIKDFVQLADETAN
jgi:hypothetical protein